MVAGELVGGTLAIKGIVATFKSIFRDVHEIVKTMKGLKSEFRPTHRKRLDNVLFEATEIITNYLDMFRKFHDAIVMEETDVRARKALKEFHVNREELLLLRRALLAELSAAVKDEKLYQLHDFFLSIIRLLDVSELHVGTYRPAHGSLSHMIVEEIDLDEPFTKKRRAMVRKRIRYAQDYLEQRWNEIIRNYVQVAANFSLFGGQDPHWLGKLREQVSRSLKRSRRATNKKKDKD
jgi:hypothetical protein